MPSSGDSLYINPQHASVLQHLNRLVWVLRQCRWYCYEDVEILTQHCSIAGPAFEMLSHHWSSAWFNDPCYLVVGVDAATVAAAAAAAAT